MGFVPFPEVYKAEMVFTLHGQWVENVHYFTSNNGQGAAEMQGLFEALDAWWSTTARGYAAADLALQKIKVTDMSAINAPATEYPVTVNKNGMLVGASLPANVTLAVHWSTYARGRSYRGRTYHLGLTEDKVTGSTVDAAFVTLLQASYEVLIELEDPTATYSYRKVVASRISNGVERQNGVATLVTTCTVDPTIDSQRRRLPGRGK